jgi:hypothetical protein
MTIDTALASVEVLARGLREFGKRSREGHALELRVRADCNIKPWPVFNRWLNCSSRKRGPSFAAVHQLVVAIRQHLPKRDADQLLRKAFAKQNKESGGHFFGHMMSQLTAVRKICFFCGTEHQAIQSNSAEIVLCQHCAKLLDAL